MAVPAFILSAAVSLDLVSRRRVLALLRSYGWNATSFQVLEPDFRYWFDGDGCVAYVDTGTAWVVAGGPLAGDDRLGEVARRFVASASASGRRVVFFAVEQRLLDAFPMRSLQIGEQAIWRPEEWEAMRRGHRSLREQLRRARAKGVVIERIDPADLQKTDVALRAELRALIARWLETRPMPPMAFLVELEPFVFGEERRYYLARVDGALRGALVAVPIYQRHGWFFEDILRDPLAPNGTVESLIDVAMRDIARDGALLATLGLAPLAGPDLWLRSIRQVMRPFYNFEGLRRFKAKFRPMRWDPIFAAWPGTQPAPIVLFDVLSAFARGRPFAFAAIATFRRPGPALALLAGLLIPWTMLLAHPAAARWFPSDRVRFAWVAFDALAAAGLVTLARRWRTPLAGAMAAAVAADAALTIAQASRFNAPRVTRWWEPLVIVAAVAAPIVAASVLGGALWRRASLKS